MGFLNGDGKTKRGEDVYLADLVRENGILDGFRFEDCRVRGPVVIVVQGEFDLVNNTIEGDPDAFLWELPDERDRVTGAILVKDTAFEGCTFTNVGFAGHSDFIEQVKQGVEARHALS
jgi:hypothetical protein